MNEKLKFAMIYVLNLPWSIITMIMNKIFHDSLTKFAIIH